MEPMNPEDGTERRRWRPGLAGATIAVLGGLVVFVGGDVAAHGLSSLSTPLAIRVGVGLTLLLTVAVLPRLGGWLGRIAGLVGPSLGVVVFVVALAATGGTASYLHSWLIAVPLFLALLSPEHSLSALLAGLVLLLALFVALVAIRSPGPEIISELATILAAEIVAIAGGLTYREILKRELAAEQAGQEAARGLVETQARLRESDRLALLGQLAAGVTHDIKNPLAYVKANLGFLDEVLDKGEEQDPKELRAAVRDALQGTEAIGRILADMGRIARQDVATEPIPVDLSDVAAEACRLVHGRLQLVAQLEVDVPDTLPAALGDRQAILRILVNLLSNAADALGGAGRRGDGRVRVTGRVESAEIRLSVEDNGPGVPAELRDRIFQAFFTTKPVGEGTGLGLAMAGEALERMGGRLALESPAGGGARFVVCLQRAQAVCAAG